MSHHKSAICKHCGEPFTAATKDLKRGYAKFCSRECGYKGRKKPACNTPRATAEQKVRANGLVNMRLRRKKIAQPKCCEICGAEKNRLDKHHDDYAKPGEVRWLCRSCHMKLHWSNKQSATVKS
jgi:hypothetical protein